MMVWKRIFLFQVGVFSGSSRQSSGVYDKNLSQEVWSFFICNELQVLKMALTAADANTHRRYVSSNSRYTIDIPVKTSLHMNFPALRMCVDSQCDASVLFLGCKKKFGRFFLDTAGWWRAAICIPNGAGFKLSTESTHWKTNMTLEKQPFEWRCISY